MFRLILFVPLFILFIFKLRSSFYHIMVNKYDYYIHWTSRLYYQVNNV